MFKSCEFLHVLSKFVMSKSKTIYGLIWKDSFDICPSCEKCFSKSLLEKSWSKHITLFQPGSVIFGNGSNYDNNTCKFFDDGNHNDTQDYVQKVKNNHWI